MTFDFFTKFYDLSDYKINKVYIKNNKLYVDAIMNIHLELIANGYRPELEMDQEKTFVFNVSSIDKEYMEPYEIKNVSYDDMSITINGDTLKVTDLKVEVI